VLGYLFKDTTTDKERDELIIMIQPTVIETGEDQITVNEVEKNRTILGRERRLPANPSTHRYLVSQSPIPSQEENDTS